MNTLKTETKDHYLLIRLDRGRSNPINAEMVKDMRSVFQEIPHDPTIQGVILTGKDHFFSTGLDVIELYDYDMETMKTFWKDLYQMLVEMASFPKPLVAAITGHGPAGGCVLALCCDYRIMAEGPYKIGLNEIPVGIVLPICIYHLFAFAIGEGPAYQHIMDGTLMPPSEAYRIGLIHEVVQPDQVLARAEAKMKQYLGFNLTAWQESKRLLRQPLLERLKADFESAFTPTLNQWWSPEARAMLREMIARLKK